VKRTWMALFLFGPLATGAAHAEPSAAGVAQPGAAAASQPAETAEPAPAPAEAKPQEVAAPPINEKATDPEEQFEIARRYQLGKSGTEENQEEAAKWFRKAAEQGHARAQTNLGMSYYYGRGVPRDETESLRWLRKAAEQNHPKAQFELGVAYRDGKGVPQDKVRAMMWMILSAGQGGIAARVVGGGLSRSLTPEARQEARMLARQWRESHGLPRVPGRQPAAESADAAPSPTDEAESTEAPSPADEAESTEAPSPADEAEATGASSPTDEAEATSAPADEDEPRDS
jgi:TPR repeat protein